MSLDSARSVDKGNVETVVLADPKVLKLSPGLVEKFRDQLADLYFKAWNGEGLCDTREQARHVIDSLDLSETFVVEDGGNVYAMINTLPAHTPDVADLFLRFLSYSAVQRKSMADRADPPSKDQNPNYRICFSITAKKEEGKDFKCPSQSPDGKFLSLFRFLILNLPNEPGVRKIADSRMTGVKGDPVDFYFENRIKRAGPVSMHEHNGALTIGIVEGSRPRDTASGGTNVWVAYPIDDEETAGFNRYKAGIVNEPPLAPIVEKILTETGQRVVVLDSVKTLK
jgi:hypothetical protein